MPVLVAYTTSRGSTEGIAVRIAAVLGKRGLTTHVRALTEDIDVDEYDAVVLGSPVHGGRWLPSAAEFAVANAEPLSRRPVWLFSVSTLGDEESMFPPPVARALRRMQRETRQISVLRGRIHPRGHRNFAGVIARTDWPPTGRAVFWLLGGKYGDQRNWRAVDAWAERIAATLNAPQPEPGRIEPR